jgi:putative hydrolase of the HAD superfamily
VPLLLVDLDNTLIDRAGAFARWARQFVSARHGAAVDVQWLIDADRDGAVLVNLVSMVIP